MMFGLPGAALAMYRTAKDKKRKVFYKNYTGRSWGRSQNYDLCLNSGKLGIDECADVIVRLAQK